MFYDLLTRNSKEYFPKGLADGYRKSGEKAKLKDKEGEDCIEDFFKESKTFGRPATTRNQKLFFEKTNNKMAVNRNRTGRPEMARDEREETKMNSKKSSYSLEQEMNLARRACWCNNKLDDLKGQQEQQLQQQQQCCDNCFKRLNQQTNGDDNDNKENLNENNDDDANENGDDDDSETTTKVLNGAKNFSKNLNLIYNDNNNATETINNCNSNNNNSNNSEMFSNTTITTTTTNSLRNRKNPEHKIAKANSSLKSKEEKDEEEDAGAVTAASNTNTNAAKYNKDSCVHNNNNKTIASTATTTNDGSEPCPSNLMARLRVILLQIWLAFVEFCDKNTIKPNDPRFGNNKTSNNDAGQQKQQTKQQPQQSKQQSTNTFSSASSSSSTSTAKAKKPFQLKLLTNKKLIFLFVVCVFFSCLNRIEARPNLDSSNNVINGGNGGAVAENAAAAAGGLSGPSINNGIAATQTLDSSGIASKQNSCFSCLRLTSAYQVSGCFPEIQKQRT
ncbi:hypothetical protein DOY81_001724 [Sarcophaga bullata]|nr:hypothetical protein DOY81_001724 [Sarcophaga bullata]